MAPTHRIWGTVIWRENFNYLTLLALCARALLMLQTVPPLKPPLEVPPIVPSRWPMTDEDDAASSLKPEEDTSATFASVYDARLKRLAKAGLIKLSGKTMSYKPDALGKYFEAHEKIKFGSFERACKNKGWIVVKTTHGKTTTKQWVYSPEKSLKMRRKNKRQHKRQHQRQQRHRKRRKHSLPAH